MNTREILVFKTLAWKQTLTTGGLGSLNADLVDRALDETPSRPTPSQRTFALASLSSWPRTWKLSGECST